MSEQTAPQRRPNELCCLSYSDGTESSVSRLLEKTFVVLIYKIQNTQYSKDCVDELKQERHVFGVSVDTFIRYKMYYGLCHVFLTHPDTRLF